MLLSSASWVEYQMCSHDDTHRAGRVCNKSKSSWRGEYPGISPAIYADTCRAQEDGVTGESGVHGEGDTLEFSLQSVN